MKKSALLFLFLIPGSLFCLGRKTSADSPQAERPALPQKLYRRLSPSVFTVQVFGRADRPPVASGSAVAIASDEVVTNRHVVAAGYTYKVKQGDKSWKAIIAWIDPNHDLALLRVAGLHATPIPLRVSPSVAVGERVYAIGAPEGLELTMSEGIVSGLRNYEAGYVIQTTAPVSPGSSGGGLFDQEGRLVGVTSFGLVEGENLNFALPASWVEACPRHPAGDHAVEPISKQERGTLGQVDTGTSNLSTFELSAVTEGAAVSAKSSATGIENAVNSMELNCLLEPKGPDCPENWPAWQQISTKMLELRMAIRQARPYEDGTSIAAAILRQMVEDLSTNTYSGLTVMYCEELPGGLYTDLDGEIRACPKLH